MATRASKSKRTPPSRGKKVKRGLKKSGGRKGTSKVDPLPGPRRELVAPPRAKAKKPVVDPLPGDDPFDL